MICVECGKEAPSLLGGSCPACFVLKTPLLLRPEVFDVEVCAHCDARHVGAHWFDPDEGVGLDWVREEACRSAVKAHPRVFQPVISVEERQQDERNFIHHLRLTGTIEGVPVGDEGDVLVRMRRSVCDRCSRMFGGYYAAVIQLRATDRDVTEHELLRAHKVIGDELDRQRARGNRESFLTKSGAVPGGFDYYLGDIEGTRGIANVLSDKIGGVVEEHAKLVGRQLGEDVFRVTFRVRVRLFAAGDFALVDDKLVQFLSASRGRAMVMRLSDRGTDKIDEERLRRVGGTEILQEAIMVSHDARNLQVMDPVTFQTVDVPRPPGFEPVGQSIWVLRHEERLYIPALPFTPPKPAKPPKGPKGPKGTAPRSFPG